MFLLYANVLLIWFFFLFLVLCFTLFIFSVLFNPCSHPLPNHVHCRSSRFPNPRPPRLPNPRSPHLTTHLSLSSPAPLLLSDATLCFPPLTPLYLLFPLLLPIYPPPPLHTPSLSFSPLERLPIPPSLLPFSLRLSPPKGFQRRHLTFIS